MTNISSKFFFLPLTVLAIVLHFLNEAYLAVCLGLSLLLILSSTEESSREFRVLMYYAFYSVFVLRYYLRSFRFTPLVNPSLSA